MVIIANLEPKIAQQRDIAERQVALFSERFSSRYGSSMLDFACHAAFPLTLTTDLVYLLRQEYFVDTLPWSAAPELILSNLCDAVGFDLYAMSIPIQQVLREKLVEKFTSQRLDNLARWMTVYIHHRLEIDRSDRAKILGYPSEWTTLACLKSDEELTKAIKEHLQQILAQSKDPNDRFRLLALVKNHSDLLVQRGLKPIKLQDLAEKLGRNQLDTETTDENIDNLEIAESDDALHPFEFEIVKVDVKGQIIQRDQKQTFIFQELLCDGLGLEMVAIPSGKFMMGSPESEHQRWVEESPCHEVTVAPFFIGKYPITQAQWRTIANTPMIARKINPDPSNFKGHNRPVEHVFWEEAVEFCQRLSRQTGREYRLPSEAEWEYACRSGTTTAFHFGETITGKLANYNSNITYNKESKIQPRGETTSVGDFPPNAFGLYDMHGNVWEWCLDYWHNSYEGAPSDGSAWLLKDNNDNHVLRGGAWCYYPRDCRSATRINYNPDVLYFNFGFRVVCESQSLP